MIVLENFYFPGHWSGVLMLIQNWCHTMKLQEINPYPNSEPYVTQYWVAM